MLREDLGQVTVTRAAQVLHVTRAALSRVLNGSAGTRPPRIRAYPFDVRRGFCFDRAHFLSDTR